MLENTDFEKDKVFVNDFISNENFIDDVVVGELFTFYGVAYQSELYSASQLDLPGCWGQFLSLCKSLKEGDEDIQSKKIEDIVYLNDIDINKDKKTVIFLYNIDLKKRHFKNFIRPILEEIKKDPSFDYIVLSMDYNRIREH